MLEKLQIIERQKDALQKLNEIASISNIIPKETLRQALEVGKEHFGLELAIVSHIVGEQYTVEVQSSPPDTLYDGQLFELGHTYCNTTLELDDALMIEDVNKSKYIGHPCYREYKLVSYIGAPVRVNGDVYGTINFSSPSPYNRAYDETDAEFIRLLARWAGSFLEKQYALDSLKASELRLQTIIQNEPECVKVVDAAGNLIYMNSAGLEMIEAESLEQVYGQSIYGVIAPEYRAEYADLHKNVMCGKKMHMQYEVLGLKGGRRWLETHAVPFQDKNVLVQLAITRDISERKKAEDALNALNESLEQKVKLAIEELRNKDQIMIQQSKMAAMGEMVGVIAHQWKQPLNSLSLIVQDIQMAFSCGELDDEYMKNTTSSSVALIQYMSKTIDDFRNFFRPDKEKVHFLAVDIIKQTLSIMQTQLDENNIVLEVVEADKNIEILGYPNELMQVLLNLINNAKDAILEKIVETPLITIAISTENKQAIICIKDNAGGIPDNLIETIFKPFFTTKSKEHGTGIGLSISKTIIEQNMNGTLSAKNISDGMEFKIVIPC